MALKPVPLTKAGLKRLEKELELLKAKRKEVAESLHRAVELGTSQNDSEYDIAKDEQARVEGKIRELSDIISRAELIDERGAHTSQRVMVGSGIEVEQDGKHQHFQIVGPPEADIAKGRISHESPIGEALLGRAVGDEVNVNVPRGVIRLKVLAID